MFRLAAALICLALPASAADVDAILDEHILPRFERLASSAEALATAAGTHCEGTDPALRDAYGTAFDAWIEASHLRFGPTEQDDRAFALSFWPDTRGATPKALAGLIASADPVVDSEDGFATVSIAARGFYALEYLAYDDAIMAMETPAYRCALVQAITTDIAANSDAILRAWQPDYAALMRTPGNDIYRDEGEVLQELFKAVALGLQVTSDTRLGRPHGDVRPATPARAEARRSGRSQRHVLLSLQSTRDLALMLADGHPDVQGALDVAYGRAIDRAEGLADDPDFSGAADPMGRFRLETLQSEIDTIRDIVGRDLAPLLGVTAGFNAFDGD